MARKIRWPGECMKKLFLLLASHVAVGIVGFGAGIYVLPIIIAPPSPADSEVVEVADGALYSGRFRSDLDGSDPFHWGEGMVFVGPDSISLQGMLAPGPDYKLYLSPEFVNSDADFIRLRHVMVRVGDVRTFENFIVPVPQSVDPGSFSTVIVWCETFEQFITAARYR
jgi:hypothetical protein